MEWRENLLTDDADVKAMLEGVKRIAVLGIKPESHSAQPAFYVPKYMADRGFDVIPVPVYYPEATEILGKPVYRTLAEIPGEVDLVNVFRRPTDIPQHTDDILMKHPKAVWFQAGIRNDQVAEILAKAGIKVVQDSCLMVDHRMLFR